MNTSANEAVIGLHTVPTAAWILWITEHLPRSRTPWITEQLPPKPPGPRGSQSSGPAAAGIPWITEQRPRSQPDPLDRRATAGPQSGGSTPE